MIVPSGMSILICGIDETSNWLAVLGELSTLTDRNIALPSYSLATSSNIGAKRRHGPHHGALKSMTTGMFSSGVIFVSPVCSATAPVLSSLAGTFCRFSDLSLFEEQEASAAQMIVAIVKLRNVIVFVSLKLWVVRSCAVCP